MKFLRILAALTLTLGAALGSPSAAFAHDEVSSTSPSNKATVAAGVFDVSVTFGEDVLNVANGKGIVIQVFAPGMKYVSTDCVRVDGKTIATRVDVDRPGKYAVAWQSVSSDGHSNTGVFAFTVTNSNNYKSGKQQVCSKTAIGPGPSASATPSKSTDSSIQTVIQGVLFTLILLGAGAFLTLRYRRNLKKRVDSGEN